MEIKSANLIGAIAGIIIIGLASAFYFVAEIKSVNLSYFLFGIGFLMLFLPFVVSTILSTKIEREKDKMFLEFTRSLVQNVESGTPVSKSIINLKAKSFGSLSPHIEKLANQIQLGIPVKDALETFAYDTKSKTIIRAIALIREAEKAGGDIGPILESVAKSVSEIEKLKDERRSAISAIVAEGYIIFFIFIIIMILMEVKIIPMTTGIGGMSSSASNLAMANQMGFSKGNSNPSQYTLAFLGLLITQGIFSGLVIGKLAEGSLKAGIKHSFITTSMALLISTGVKYFLSI